MTKQSLTQKFGSWCEGEAGFYTWLADIKPRIRTRSNRYELFEPTIKQRRFITEVFKTTKTGESFKRSMFLNIEPRRHGKSTVFALLCLHFFTSRENFTIQLLGASEDHCRRVQYNVLLGIINNTPKLSKMIPEKYHQTYTIKFPYLGGMVQYGANNASASFGDKINLLWVSDLHAFSDLGAFNALQAALLDSDDSLMFIDSNVDTTGGHVHQLQNEAAEDTSIYCQYTSYNDLVHYLKAAPSWIDRKKAKRLQKTTLPADFARDILGQRLDAKNALFPAETIKQCQSHHKIPVSDIQAITRGRAYKIGAGLDRAKSLVQVGRGDASVWTVVLKVAAIEGEPEFYLLNQVKFRVNSDRAIKAQILEDHNRYGLDNVVLENYEVSSIHAWMLEQKIPVEMIHPSDSVQNAAFPEMHRIFNEGRFHYPESMEDFTGELSSFAYTRRKNGFYSFGHATARQHDDRVYSACWAIFSLRREVLTTYVLESNIECHNRTSKRRFCFLMGGELIMHCAEKCSAAIEIEGMYQEFKQLQMESELSMAGFFRSYCKVEGAICYQAV